MAPCNWAIEVGLVFVWGKDILCKKIKFHACLCYILVQISNNIIFSFLCLLIILHNVKAITFAAMSDVHSARPFWRAKWTHMCFSSSFALAIVDTYTVLGEFFVLSWAGGVGDSRVSLQNQAIPFPNDTSCTLHLLPNQVIIYRERGISQLTIQYEKISITWIWLGCLQISFVYACIRSSVYTLNTTCCFRN